jgi:hypothetical protein
MTDEENKKIDTIIKHVASLDEYNSLSFRNLGKSFSLGIAGAFGATVGLAIVIALLSFLAKEFGGLPFIGKLFSNLGQYLHN